MASLELSMDAPANAGACTGNLSCVYTHTLSWRSPTQPLPMEWNPRAVFEKLFGDSGSTDRAAREARLQQHKSILDSVTGKLASLKQRARAAGPGARWTNIPTRFATWNAAFRGPSEQSDIELPAMEQPLGAPPVFEDHLALMMDLQVLAFQSDLTRVITFMIGKEQSARPYPQIGVPEAHHPLSHHNNIPELIEKHVEDQPLSRAVVLAVSGEAARDARRRRLAARPHDDPVRRGHFQQQRGIRATTCRCWWWAAEREGSRAAGISSMPTSPRWRTCW